MSFYKNNHIYNIEENNEPELFKSFDNPFNLNNPDIFGDNQMENDYSNNITPLCLSNSNSNESKCSLNMNIESAITREFSNNISNNIFTNSEPLINTNNENDNIKELNNANAGVKFLSKKKGRPKKGQENRGNKIHTKNSNDNASKKIINSCKSNIYNLIRQYIPIQSGIKLDVPTIQNQLGSSHEDINKFFNKTIHNIFCDTIPKRVKEEIKDNREQHQHNKNIIDILLENEKNDEKKQIKVLNGLFNLCFKDYLIAYLNDETQIKISDDEIINLNGFKTFGSCFNEGKNKYDSKEKNTYKEHILKIIYNPKKNTKAKK